MLPFMLLENDKFDFKYSQLSSTGRRLHPLWHDLRQELLLIPRSSATINFPDIRTDFPPR